MPSPAKASLWFMFTSVINQGVSFLTTPLFTRLLTQEEYGVLSLYNTWISILTIIITLQLASGAFNKAMVKFENDRNGYTSSMLFLTTCLWGVWLLIFCFSKGLWSSLLGLNKYIIFMIFLEILASTTWGFYSIRNRFEYKYKMIVSITIITNIVATLFSLLLVLRVPNYKVEAKIFGTVFVHCITYGFFYIYLIAKGKKLFNSSYWKYSVLYSIPLVPHYLSQLVLNQSDRIMISRYCGNADAGMYALSYQLAIVMQIITNAIHASFMPWCFQRIKEGQIKKIGDRALQIIIAIGLICLMFPLFAPELILILGGSNYYEAVYIVPPVSMSVLFLTMYSFFGNIEFYFEKTKLIMFASVVVATSNIVLNAVFIPIYGFIAAGYTTLVCYILYSFIHYIFMKKICDENNIENPFAGRKIWLIAMSFATISVLVSFIYKFTLARYSFIVCIMICLFIFYKKNTINKRG